MAAAEKASKTRFGFRRSKASMSKTPKKTKEQREKEKEEEGKGVKRRPSEVQGGLFDKRRKSSAVFGGVKHTALVGRRVDVMWSGAPDTNGNDGVQQWYTGVVKDYDPKMGKYVVVLSMSNVINDPPRFPLKYC